MFRSGKGFPKTLVPMFLGLGMAGIAVGGCHAGSPSELVQCEISANTSGGMTSLKGVVHADKTVHGSYRLRIKSSGASGSSNIEQGGEFTAGPGSPATLGTVTLSGPRLDADLIVNVGGRAIACTDHVGRI